MPWLEKHIKNEHPEFWKKKKDLLSGQKQPLIKKPSIYFEYKFNKNNGDIVLKKIDLENPEFTPKNLVSNISISYDSNRVEIKVKADDGRIIYKKSKKSKETDYIVNHLTLVELCENLFFRKFFGRWMLDLTESEKQNEQLIISDIKFNSSLDDIMGKTNEKEKTMDYHSYILWRSEIMKKYENLDSDDKLFLYFMYKLNLSIREMYRKIGIVKDFLYNIDHIGPLRNWPERIYLNTGGKPRNVGIAGESMQQILWRDKKVGGEKLIEKINNWLDKLKFGCKIEVFPIGVSEIYQLKVRNKGLETNISDVGFGLSQILPIITECINKSILKQKERSETVNLRRSSFRRNRYDPIIFIEEPEIHLNPRIQAGLGDFFIEMSESNMKFLIETHSEHIITRIQRRIVERTLKPTDVVLYFTSKEGNETKIKEIRFSEDGSFDYWPEGFFQDDYEDALEILKSSLRDMGGKDE